MDYWKILNLKEGASLEEIKKSYRNLVKEFHPDHNPRPEAKTKFLEIQKAYDFLKDNPDYRSPENDCEEKNPSSQSKSPVKKARDENGSTYKRNYHENYNPDSYKDSSRTSGFHRSGKK